MCCWLSGWDISTNGVGGLEPDVTNDLDPARLDMALAALMPPTARPPHAARVRQRCHAVLGVRRTERSRSLRASDVLAAGAVAFYLMATFGEALQLLGR